MAFQTRRDYHQDKYKDSDGNAQFVDMSPVNCLIDHMFIILVFVPAEREGDWPLHLCAMENMLS